MDNKLKIIILIFFVLFSCKLPHSKLSTDYNKEIKESLEWKGLALCLCIYEIPEFTNDMQKKDGSVAAVLQTSEKYDLDDLEKTKDFVKTMLEIKNESTISKVGNNLQLMKCIEIYNSKELENFVNEL